MKRRSKDQWQGLVAEQESSGKSQQEFCAKRGVSVASLQYWKRKLREDSFVEIPVVSQPHLRGEAVVEFPGGAVLRVLW